MKESSELVHPPTGPSSILLPIHHRRQSVNSISKRKQIKPKKSIKKDDLDSFPTFVLSFKEDRYNDEEEEGQEKEREKEGSVTVQPKEDTSTRKKTGRKNEEAQSHSDQDCIKVPKEHNNGRRQQIQRDKIRTRRREQLQREESPDESQMSSENQPSEKENENGNIMEVDQGTSKENDKRRGDRRVREEEKMARREGKQVIKESTIEPQEIELCEAEKEFCRSLNLPHNSYLKLKEEMLKERPHKPAAKRGSNPSAHSSHAFSNARFDNAKSQKLYEFFTQQKWKNSVQNSSQSPSPPHQSS